MADRKAKVLILDDEPDMVENLERVLHRAGYQCVGLTDSTTALTRIEEEQPDLVVTDLRMPGIDGMALLEQVRARGWSIPVIMITGYATIDAAVEAMKKGASDFLAKPFPPNELILRIERTLEHVRVLEENRDLRQRLQSGPQTVTLVGQSPLIRGVLEIIEKISGTDSRVLITGESGTGKELVARAIHERSPRREKSFFAINCVALTETLLESELFGHKRGAFTGAIATKKGIFELADGGTLFLDEIGDTGPSFQAKLLRVLEEGEIKRGGGTRPIRVDVRVIASTNRDLRKAIAKGAFREDLFYRLSVVSIHLPPLRERKEDIPLLVQHFLQKHSLKLKKRVKTVSPKAMDLLMRYPWPGNVRELENALERAVIMASGEEIQVEDLPLTLPEEGGRGLKGGTLEELEKELIRRTLEECGWNKTMAARKLGIGRRTLYEKAARYGIPLGPNG